MRRSDRQLTDKNEIAAIFRKADACRVAFAVDNEPYIVCLNYGFEWEGELPVLYFHCAHEGKKLDMMRRNNRVCFQLDTDHALEYIEKTVNCSMLYSSVVGMGRLEVVRDEAERIHGLNLLMAQYGHPAPEQYPSGSLSRTTMLRLRVDEMSAKQSKPK